MVLTKFQQITKLRNSNNYKIEGCKFMINIWNFDLVSTITNLVKILILLNLEDGTLNKEIQWR